MANYTIQQIPGGEKVTPVSTDTLELQETAGGTSYYFQLANLYKAFGSDTIDDIAEIATALKSGLDPTLITGTKGDTGVGLITGTKGDTGVGFFNSDGDLVTDTTNFVWDNTNKRLGVGTASPINAFHVLVSGASGLGATPADKALGITGNSGDCRLYLESPDATSGQRVFFINNGGGNLTVSSTSDNGGAFVKENILGLTYDGEVGIGTNSPTDILTIYEATNDANPAIKLGSADAEELIIQSVYDSGAQTLNYVLFQTDTAGVTANKGLFRFNVDATNILDIDDGGIDLDTGMALSINGTDVLDATTLGANVVNSSLTQVGTIATGTWEGTTIAVDQGGKLYRWTAINW
jgi:hypothetical protein